MGAEKNAVVAIYKSHLEAELRWGEHPIAPVRFRGLWCQNEYQMITLFKRIGLLLLAATLLAVGGVGCNTAHGFGKDVSRTGDAIQNGTK